MLGVVEVCNIVLSLVICRRDFVFCWGLYLFLMRFVFVVVEVCICFCGSLYLLLLRFVFVGFDVIYISFLKLRLLLLRLSEFMCCSR